MGVSYFVDPFDPTDADEREYLEAEGVDLPRGKKAGRGRNPTPAEIRQVCDAIDGFGVTYNASKKDKCWQADFVGIARRDRSRGALLSIEKWGGSEDRRYKIMFENSDPDVVLRVLHALSAHTGPLLVTPDSYPPLVVWPEADLKKLMRQWK